MFAFYFAILSAITPPVALAVFAAASLAKADLWASGWAAVRVGAAGFIVPFMFVFEPSLLMIGAWPEILHSFITATIGTMCLAAGLFGYLLREARIWERVLLVAAALLLIKPGLVTDLIGLVLLGGRRWSIQLVASAARTRAEPRQPRPHDQQADALIIRFIRLIPFAVLQSAGHRHLSTSSENMIMSNIGFIGLGIMGKPMALNLIKGGHTLFLHSRSGVPQGTHRRRRQGLRQREGSRAESRHHHHHGARHARRRESAVRRRTASPKGLAKARPWST